MVNFTLLSIVYFFNWGLVSDLLIACRCDSVSALLYRFLNCFTFLWYPNTSLINKCHFFLPCNVFFVRLGTWAAVNNQISLQTHVSASGSSFPRVFSRIDQCILLQRSRGIYPNSFTPLSVNWVFVGRAESRCIYILQKARRLDLGVSVNILQSLVSSGRKSILYYIKSN